MEQKNYTQNRWTNPWLICILFALWPLYGIPLIIGVLLLLIRIRDEKKYIEYTDSLRDEVQQLNSQIVTLVEEKNNLESIITPEIKYSDDITQNIKILTEKQTELSDDIEDLNTQILGLNNDIIEKKKLLVEMDEEILVQEFGLYKPTFEFASSLDYKEALANVRSLQKKMIKEGKATKSSNSWTVAGSAAKGKKMTNDITKLLLRAFNTECDDIVAKVKYTNFDASLDRIYKSSESITKLGSVMSISITNDYISAKIKELRLAFEYQQKKQEEKEAAKLAREEQKENAKLLREIEAQRNKLEKEQNHYQTVFEKLEKQLAEHPDDAALLEKKTQLENTLEEISKGIADVDYRQANMRAGYVYIISNIGSFGENVYKIGMTRRLDPMDRIDELGDASVPFKFDVHAMIFSDDAPALEAALHQAFADKKVNMVNQRREFFKVTLDEIKEVVKKNYDKTVEFIDVADAEQYRVSEKMRAS